MNVQICQDRGQAIKKKKGRGEEGGEWVKKKEENIYRVSRLDCLLNLISVDICRVIY